MKIFKPKKILCPKKSASQKIFVQKIFLSKMMLGKQSLNQKKNWVQKNVGPEKLWFKGILA